MIPWSVGPKLYPVADLSLLTPLNRALAELAEATPSYEYALAIAGLQALARKVVAWSLDYDAVLTPALAKLPVPIGWVFEPEDPWEQFARGGEFTPFTPFVNVTGQPAISIPFDVAEGLPVGDPADRAPRRRGDADPPGLAARGRSAVGRPATAGCRSDLTPASGRSARRPR